MPLPKTKDIGKIMKFLKSDKPGMSRKQMIAIALSQTGKSKNYNKDVVAKALAKRSKS